MFDSHLQLAERVVDLHVVYLRWGGEWGMGGARCGQRVGRGYWCVCVCVCVCVYSWGGRRRARVRAGGWSKVSGAGVVGAGGWSKVSGAGVVWAGGAGSDIGRWEEMICGWLGRGKWGMQG
jgi:hypothetical protein